MMSRIVIAGSSAYDVDASSASRLLPSPTRPPRVDPADLTHLCAGITIGGGTATSGSAPGDEIGSASAPGGNANGPVGVGVGEGEGLASILATAGTICFDARLGAGDLNPNGGATRAGLAASGPRGIVLTPTRELAHQTRRACAAAMRTCAPGMRAGELPVASAGTSPGPSAVPSTGRRPKCG